jgi:glycosyltransferase involved in cell wall biosynthesis
MGQVGTKKIALVHDFLFTYGGAERVLSIFCTLFPEAPVYTLLADPAVVAKHFPNTTIITSPLQRSFLHSKPSLLIAAMPQAIESFSFEGYDLILSSSGAFSHAAITGPDTMHICYCHSPMRYAWDWHSEYLTERGLTKLPRFLAEMVISRIRVWDTFSALRPDHWIANSANVQARLQRYYGVESAVIHPPVDTHFFDPAHITLDATRPAYAVTASRLSAYKHIDWMIEAAADTKFPLVVIGDGSQRNALEKLAKKLNAPVTFVGKVSDLVLRETIGHASCFLFASEDDFGISPVEALSMGIPVIAYGKGGALETVRAEKNGLLFMQPTAESLTSALTLFLSKGVQYVPSQIRQSALMFSTEQFVTKIKQVVEHA